MSLSLSLVITTLNESENIAPCIQSVGDLATEIVVMDNFSSDSTPDVARSANAKVFQRQFDNFSENKNAAIDSASGDWILILDADERLTAHLRNEIRNVLESKPQFDAFRLKRDTFFLGRYVRCWSRGSVIRLFRKNSARYNPSKLVHEELIVESNLVGTLKHPMDHYTFRSFEQYLPKVHSYTTLAAREAYQKGERANWISLCVLPPSRFLRTYFLKGGILDGIPGFIISCFSAYSVFLKTSKIWQLQRKESHN